MRRGLRMSESHRVAIVGAGPAGLFAALTAKAINPAAEVAILDDSGDPWKALEKLDGLVGVDCYDAESFTEAFPVGARELLGPFYQWTPDEHREWLEQRNARPTPDERGALRLPQASELINVFKREILREGIVLKTTDRVVHCDASKAGHKFWLTLADDSTVETDAVVLATGGMLSGGSAKLIEELGHTVRPPVPALFHLQTADERFRGLGGVTVDPTQCRIPGFDEAVAEGPMTFEPWGFGGLAVLTLGALAADRLAKVRYRFILEVNWLAGLPQASKALADQARRFPRQRLGAEPLGGLPERLWRQLIQGAGLSLEAAWGNIERETWGKLQQALTRCPIEIHRKRLFHGESAVSGGVNLAEIHPKRMASRLVPGLYFAGQALDYYALPGGYNLQAEWLTGRIAGACAATRNDH